MKINKEIKTVTEEIEIPDGTYYFQDLDFINHKITIQTNEDLVDYKMISVTNFSNVYGIRAKEDYLYLGDENEELPYIFRGFVLGSGKNITEEDFNKEKQEVLNKL